MAKKVKAKTTTEKTETKTIKTGRPLSEEPIVPTPPSPEPFGRTVSPVPVPVPAPASHIESHAEERRTADITVLDDLWSPGPVRQEVTDWDEGAAPGGPADDPFEIKPSESASNVGPRRASGGHGGAHGGDLGHGRPASNWYPPRRISGESNARGWNGGAGSVISEESGSAVGGAAGAGRGVWDRSQRDSYDVHDHDGLHEHEHEHEYEHDHHDHRSPLDDHAPPLPVPAPVSPPDAQAPTHGAHEPGNRVRFKPVMTPQFASAAVPQGPPSPTDPNPPAAFVRPSIPMHPPGAYAPPPPRARAVYRTTAPPGPPQPEPKFHTGWRTWAVEAKMLPQVVQPPAAAAARAPAPAQPRAPAAVRSHTLNHLLSTPAAAQPPRAAPQQAQPRSPWGVPSMNASRANAPGAAAARAGGGWVNTLGGGWGNNAAAAPAPAAAAWGDAGGGGGASWGNGGGHQAQPAGAEWGDDAGGGWGEDDGGEDDGGWGQNGDDGASWEEEYDDYGGVGPEPRTGAHHNQEAHAWGAPAPAAGPSSRARGPSPAGPTSNSSYSPMPTTTAPSAAPDWRARHVVDGGGAPLFNAQYALFGESRRPSERIHWAYSPEKDMRVRTTLANIQNLSYDVAQLGVRHFIHTRERGALFANADHKPLNATDLALDWMTFRNLQRTLDRILQECVAYYDPAEYVIVFVFLLSKTENSMAIWRRKIAVPAQLRVTYAKDIEAAKMRLTREAIHVDEIPAHEKPMAPPPPPAQPLLKSSRKDKGKSKELPKEAPPPPLPEPEPEKKEKKKKGLLSKRKWWKF